MSIYVYFYFAVAMSMALGMADINHRVAPDMRIPWRGIAFFSLLWPLTVALALVGLVVRE